jgi:hypothetical protein
LSGEFLSQPSQRMLYVMTRTAGASAAPRRSFHPTSVPGTAPSASALKAINAAQDAIDLFIVFHS